ncbi:hypothetical protein [Methylobacterium sp. J-070]|uniref:hypothetical protein n=1 Tax=Methylobacterium sp. J-070 TaxID=2836650 RepID=UPI001FB900BA|nr:hypothetical protein [Methylobacterium sp. J-070]MCJ2052564.1 hypothetical protein [Methylobacterium sp. J-070]
MEAAGATAAFLPSGDGGAGRRLWDDLRHFTAINDTMQISLAFVSADAFAALPAERQRQVLEAARETERDQVALLQGRTEGNSGAVTAQPALLVAQRHSV